MNNKDPLDYHVAGYYSTQYEYGYVEMVLPAYTPESALKLLMERYGYNIIHVFNSGSLNKMKLSDDDKELIEQLDNDHHKKLFT